MKSILIVLLLVSSVMIHAQENRISFLGTIVVPTQSNPTSNATTSVEPLNNSTDPLLNYFLTYQGIKNIKTITYE